MVRSATFSGHNNQLTVDLRRVTKNHCGMTPGDLAALEGAVDELNKGGIESFVDLLSDDMIWSGYSHGWLWWRQRPH